MRYSPQIVLYCLVVLISFACSADQEIQEKYVVLDPQFSEGRSICLEKTPFSEPDTVDRFREKFHIELQVNILKLGDRIIRMDKSFEDTLKGGPSFFVLNDTTGLSISITRAADQQGKKHLYKKGFYKKREGGCWVDQNSFSSWNSFKPDSSSSLLTSFSTGEEGKVGYVGIEGELWIR